VIAFNEQHADTELQHFGQELFEIAQTRGPLTSQAYLDAVATVDRLARVEGLDKFLAGHELDSIVAPTGAPATPIDLINGDARMGGTSTLAAAAGYPLISVPAASVAGMPVGVTFMGAAWSEPTLIKLASGFEALRGPRPQPIL
jgi:amidase